MQKKLHLRKGDTAIVISGEYKGQQGRVLEVIRKNNRAIVEGVNMVTKHSKPTSQHPQGGIIKKEAPIHISNLMLIDASDGNPTRIGRKIGKENELVRYSKKTGEEIK
ncbi:50S ribosomal protein L24 [Bacteroidota bacterium]